MLATESKKKKCRNTYTVFYLASNAHVQMLIFAVIANQNANARRKKIERDKLNEIKKFTEKMIHFHTHTHYLHKQMVHIGFVQIYLFFILSRISYLLFRDRNRTNARLSSSILFTLSARCEIFTIANQFLSKYSTA